MNQYWIRFPCYALHDDFCWGPLCQPMENSESALLMFTTDELLFAHRKSGEQYLNGPAIRIENMELTGSDFLYQRL